jgi:hypothetical protein
MESIKIIIEPYLEDTTEFVFVYESSNTSNVEKLIIAYEIEGAVVHETPNGEGVTDTEKEIINAIIKTK